MRLRLSVLLLALAACSFDPTGPLFEPPAIYRQWYHDAELCSGLTGDFDAVHWQHVYDLREGGQMYAGYWYPRHKITIRDDYMLDSTLVMHESMHDLIQSGDHPSHYFMGVCGNLITLSH